MITLLAGMQNALRVAARIGAMPGSKKDRVQ
jgi:hypothetical protein